jgi:cytochrome c oxidase subunit IV
MSEEHGANPYRIYWVTWAILLVITVAMLAAESFHLPRLFLIVFLLAFMMVKASMIGGNFMHLRFERSNLSVMVGAGILVTSLILYLFTQPEAASVHQKNDAPIPVPAAAPEHHS